MQIAYYVWIQNSTLPLSGKDDMSLLLVEQSINLFSHIADINTDYLFQSIHNKLIRLCLSIIFPHFVLIFHANLHLT